MAVMFISLGEGVIYSSDPDAREPCTPTGGSGREKRRRQKAHGGGPEEARYCERACSVSQIRDWAERGQLVPGARAGGPSHVRATGGRRGSPRPSSWGRWVGWAGALVPGTSCGKRLVSLGHRGWARPMLRAEARLTGQPAPAARRPRPR